MATRRHHCVGDSHWNCAVHCIEDGERIAKERLLWEAIPTVTDLQCAWQILLQSANPRANHSMRTLPPTLSAEYCHAHDEGIWSTAKVLLGVIPEDEEAHRIATLPMRLGGLGLRSAVRCAPAAFWASWADALQMIRQRTPDVAIMVEHSLVNESPQDGCLEELRAAAAELDRQATQLGGAPRRQTTTSERRT